jgi:hypothetical protein
VTNDDDRQEHLERRDLELLKHVSTLNVATLVLLAALVRDFSPSSATVGGSKWVLLAFGVSLLLSLFGLGTTLQGRSGTNIVRAFIISAYGVFLLGLGVALGISLGVLF